jgi:hypothetical protein
MMRKRIDFGYMHQNPPLDVDNIDLLLRFPKVQRLGAGHIMTMLVILVGTGSAYSLHGT